MRFICKKNFKGKENKDLYLVSLLTDTNDIIKIYTTQKAFDSLNCKIGDLVPENKITSSSYVNQYGQVITSYLLV